MGLETADSLPFGDSGRRKSGLVRTPGTIRCPPRGATDPLWICGGPPSVALVGGTLATAALWMAAQESHRRHSVTMQWLPSALTLRCVPVVPGEHEHVSHPAHASLSLGVVGWESGFFVRSSGREDQAREAAEPEHALVIMAGGLIDGWMYWEELHPVNYHGHHFTCVELAWRALCHRNSARLPNGEDQPLLARPVSGAACFTKS